MEDLLKQTEQLRDSLITQRAQMTDALVELERYRDKLIEQVEFYGANDHRWYIDQVKRAYGPGWKIPTSDEATDVE